MFAITEDTDNFRAVAKKNRCDNPPCRLMSMVLWVASLPLLLVLANHADATLGGDEASIIADQTQMNATRHSFSSQKYTTHEIQLESGTWIKECVSPQGQVFAVTWKGPFLPDMQQILGDHFAAYEAAINSKNTRRGPVFVQRPELVIGSEGHMRAFSGHAYLPKLFPEGVTVDDIQ